MEKVMRRLNISFKMLVGLALILMTTNCDKFLDEKPQSTIIPEIFWQTKSDADTWLAGIYNSLQTTLRTNYFDWGEARADNVDQESTGNAQRKVLRNTFSANDTDVNAITSWASLYTTISLCNYGIKYYPQMIEKNIEQSASVYRDYLGQSYAIRALSYFYALRVWGRVPIVTEPVESLTEESTFPRSSIEKVRKRILDDIDMALELIGTSTVQKFYMQKASVYALQTDVYMWFQEYDNALTASQNCIDESNGTLVTTAEQWKAIFTSPQSSTETIFSLFWSSAERGNGSGVCTKLASQTNQYSIRPTIFNRLRARTNPGISGPADGRFTTSFDLISFPTNADYANASGRKFGKFSVWDPGLVRNDGLSGGGFVIGSSQDCDVHTPIYRLADILLLRAEALNHKERHQEALDIVNNIRRRVGYNVEAQLSDFSGDVIAEIEAVILTERQYEFLGEGKRWFDLCRIGNTYDYTENGYQYLRDIMNPLLNSRSGSITFEGVNIGRILLPINSDAFNANNKLRGDQNSPYDE